MIDRGVARLLPPRAKDSIEDSRPANQAEQIERTVAG
jgi:hypothetical protein